ncbi:MAG: beta-Ala-His dipeptidase, partial [Clostridiales bacterium]|nr:beta-Ala-His dipeptidase [Clostridiales bacterium]
QGTTLGADNGIAVAMGMAALTSDGIEHPPLELLITSSEETGLDGAHAVDAGSLSGKYLINLDSEEEGILTVSCAGGCTAKTNLPVLWEAANPHLAYFTISVNGLKGGHSGMEINAGKANANKLLARLLANINDKLKITLCAIEGGSKHNAIPRTAGAIIGVEKQDEFLLRECVKNMKKTFQEENKVADPDVCVQLLTAGSVPAQSMSAESSRKILQYLYLVPDGVQGMSMDIAGLVESSLNLAVIQTKSQEVEIISSMRSSVASRKEDMYNTIKTLADVLQGTVATEGNYPAWRYNPHSRLREVLIEQYEKMFSAKPAITAIHAGLECGLFDEKFDGKVDMVSIGPNLFDVHTPQEHLSISSTQRTWAYLKEILRALK